MQRVLSFIGQERKFAHYNWPQGGGSESHNMEHHRKHGCQQFVCCRNRVPHWFENVFLKRVAKHGSKVQRILHEFPAIFGNSQPIKRPSYDRRLPNSDWQWIIWILSQLRNCQQLAGFQLGYEDCLGLRNRLIGCRVALEILNWDIWLHHRVRKRSLLLSSRCCV